SLELLAGTIADEIAELEAEAERLWAEVERPALDRELADGAILSEPAGKRFSRSRGEVHRTFHRAWKTLSQMMKERGEMKAEEEAGTECVQDESAAPAVEAVAEVAVGHEVAAVVPAVQPPNEPDSQPETLEQVLEIQPGYSESQSADEIGRNRDETPSEGA